MAIQFKNFILLFVICTWGCNQSTDIANSSIAEIEQKLTELSTIDDSDSRKAEADTLWNQLVSQDKIPFTYDTTVIFLYRGEANKVQWHGDFNSWSGDKKFPNNGTRISGTDIWKLKTHFPPDARLDYKIAVDDEWMIDPINPHYQWSGFGPNSELRMPKYKPEPLQKRIPEATEGILSKNDIIKSSSLGYSVQYRVYTPPNYQNLRNLPVLYVLDGHEYADEKLGATITVLDNLIHLKKIRPIVAVFIDPRDPTDLDTNRRTEEFATNENYNAFFVQELIPQINTLYNVSTKKKDVALLGTSLGGLNTTYLGFKNPKVFGNLAIQAPAFWYKEHEIFDLVRNTKTADFNIYMSVGTIGDNILDARQMKKEFEKLKIKPNYIEVNEGHSWGAWSAQIDDILIQFFPK